MRDRTGTKKYQEGGAVIAPTPLVRPIIPYEGDETKAGYVGEHLFFDPKYPSTTSSAAVKAAAAKAAAAKAKAKALATTVKPRREAGDAAFERENVVGKSTVVDTTKHTGYGGALGFGLHSMLKAGVSLFGDDDDDDDDAEYKTRYNRYQYAVNTPPAVTFGTPAHASYKTALASSEALNKAAKSLARTRDVKAALTHPVSPANIAAAEASAAAKAKTTAARANAQKFGSFAQQAKAEIANLARDVGAPSDRSVPGGGIGPGKDHPSRGHGSMSKGGRVFHQGGSVRSRDQRTRS